MKQRIENYVFDPSTSTLVLSDYDLVEKDRLLLIVDATTNLILYNFSDVAKRATVTLNDDGSGKMNKITFTDAPMAGLASTDAILCFYDARPDDMLYSTPMLGWTGMEVVPISTERHVDRGRLRTSDPRIASILAEQNDTLDDIRTLLYKMAN